MENSIQPTKMCLPEGSSARLQAPHWEYGVWRRELASAFLLPVAQLDVPCPAWKPFLSRISPAFLPPEMMLWVQPNTEDSWERGARML